VTLVGTPRLAGLAEAYMRGQRIDDAELRREVAPTFVERDGKRTDAIVLACTHFPLLQAELERIAPWPVVFIDPAPAIAKRTEQVLRERGALGDGTEWDHEPLFNRFLTTDGRPLEPELMRFLRSIGLARTEWADWLLDASRQPTLS
jgi:glutamate racemase